MKSILAIILGSILFYASAASAQESGLLTPLYGKTLSDTFLGKTMDGTYKQPRERTGTALFTESFYKDGTTYYREGNVTDEGAWVVEEDLLCFKYKGELAGNISCFNVFISGTCIYSYHPRNVRNGKPISPNAWSVKTLIRGDVSTCDDLVS